MDGSDEFNCDESPIQNDFQYKLNDVPTTTTATSTTTIKATTYVAKFKKGKTSVAQVFNM